MYGLIVLVFMYVWFNSIGVYVRMYGLIVLVFMYVWFNSIGVYVCMV